MHTEEIIKQLRSEFNHARALEAQQNERAMRAKKALKALGVILDEKTEAATRAADLA